MTHRILLLPNNSDLSGPHEEVLAESDCDHAAVKLRMLCRNYSSARVLCVERVWTGGWYRYLWRRGEK